ncbi:MAG: hypothetical protein ACRD0V_09565 [Acidimicrobiales bacterium]
MGIKKSMAAAACGVAVALAWAAPASAKGIQSATITGPGLDDPIDVSPPDGNGGNLAALTAFWEVIPGQPAPPTLMEQAPAGRLGPRYTVTWQLMTDADETTAIRQDLYPLAEGGPLVHTAAGQPIFDGATLGGWYEAPIALRDMLSSLGVPPASAASPAKSSPATPPAVRSQSSDDWPWPPVIIGATGAVALASVGGVVAVRRVRRRERVAPIPL